MKDIHELSFPEDVRYTKEHEWAKPQDGVVRIGISDYAQDQLGDIVFVDLPRKGARLGKGDEFGTVESVKAVSELFLPVGGEIVAVNPELEEAPDRVNSDPYGGGWMVDVRPDEPGELDALMDREAYLAMLKG